MGRMIHPERLKALNDRPVAAGRCVLYWMQASQRARCNPALEYAIERANALRQPLICCFGLTPEVPNANDRHYRFLLQGLAETARDLEARGVAFVLRQGSPDAVAVELSKRASLVVTDRGYLRFQRLWRERAARRMTCPLIQVEGDVVVPIEVACPKLAWSAGTLRPRIERELGRFLVPVREARVKVRLADAGVETLSLKDPEQLLSKLGVPLLKAPRLEVEGGSHTAHRLLKTFIAERLDRYAIDRNDPSLDATSHLSPSLHFGQISPLQIALAVLKAKGKGRKAKGEGAKAFLEELVVRRELAMNYASYNDAYDRFEGVPSWARATLAAHAKDVREYRYTRPQLERGATHDPYWNAAQQEMVITGRMHGYMRMYWGKKLLEWGATPAEGFATALWLNDRYELDGRDPNGFAGIAWCFGAHDRPWAPREIFGNVRSMNAAGLNRKFDADAYARRIASLKAQVGA